MSPVLAGYSGTPLWKKLGIKPQMRVLTVAAPPHYVGLLEGMPEAASITSRGNGPFAMIHLFVKQRRELERRLDDLESKLAAGGALWISWPKQASKVATDITENTIREIVLPRGLVDVKVCAVDAVWSGLKVMRRKS
ncbi:MAG: DUF3052 domain-containing protein [Acidobacteriota bacterium]